VADLKHLLERLSGADIEFVIVGGFAAVTLSCPCQT
jgi:hypothetical protein